MLTIALFKRSLVSLLLLLLFAASTEFYAQQTGTSNPPLLSFNDLVELYEVDPPSSELAGKLSKLLTTPFINNTVGTRAAKSINTTSGTEGSYLRIATWNIERGLEFDAVKAALTNDQTFFRRLPAAARSSKYNLARIYEQAAELNRSDIIVLNEVDWGLKRTNYRNVAKELASAMQMNYAFGVEFVEVDPLTLGTETFEGETSPDKEQMVKNLEVDKSRTLGLHGTAILSRFPLTNVRLVRFVSQGHDWYLEEKKGVSKLEKGSEKGRAWCLATKFCERFGAVDG